MAPDKNFKLNKFQTFTAITFPQWSHDPNNILIIGYGLNPELCSDSMGGCYISYEYPTTNIKYSIPKTVNVELKVFDILGREIKTLVKETKNPGYYEVKFNAGNYSSGVYFYRIKAGEYIKTGKMLLLR